MHIPDYSRIDYQKIADRIGVGAQNVPHYVSIFLEQISEQLPRLKSAIDTHDFETVQNLAHSIKGSSSHLMFDELHAAAKSMESAAKARESDFDYIGHLRVLEEGIATIPA